MKSATRFMPNPSVTLRTPFSARSKRLNAAPTSAIANRLLLLSAHGWVPDVEARVIDTMGVIENSLWRYMPRPAGLSDMAVRSAPNEANAPPIPIARAEPKFC